MAVSSSSPQTSAVASPSTSSATTAVGVSWTAASGASSAPHAVTTSTVSPSITGSSATEQSHAVPFVRPTTSATSAEGGGVPQSQSTHEEPRSQVEAPQSHEQEESSSEHQDTGDDASNDEGDGDGADEGGDEDEEGHGSDEQGEEEAVDAQNQGTPVVDTPSYTSWTSDALSQSSGGFVKAIDAPSAAPSPTTTRSEPVAVTVPSAPSVSQPTSSNSPQASVSLASASSTATLAVSSVPSPSSPKALALSSLSTAASSTSATTSSARAVTLKRPTPVTLSSTTSASTTISPRTERSTSSPHPRSEPSTPRAPPVEKVQVHYWGPTFGADPIEALAPDLAARNKTRQLLFGTKTPSKGGNGGQEEHEEDDGDTAVAVPVETPISGGSVATNDTPTFRRRSSVGVHVSPLSTWYSLGGAPNFAATSEVPDTPTAGGVRSESVRLELDKAKDEGHTKPSVVEQFDAAMIQDDFGNVGLEGWLDDLLYGIELERAEQAKFSNNLKGWLLQPARK